MHDSLWWPHRSEIGAAGEEMTGETETATASVKEEEMCATETGGGTETTAAIGGITPEEVAWTPACPPRSSCFTTCTPTPRRTRSAFFINHPHRHSLPFC